MATKFLLATSDYQYNMVSSWRDQIYCSILKDGSLSIRARKDGDEASWWCYAKTGIKTPDDFIEAFESLSDDIDIDCFDFQKDIVPSLFRYSPSYAVCVSLHWEFDQEGEIEKLEFLRIFWRSFAGVCCETDLNESLSNMRDHVAEALDYVIKNGTFSLIGNSHQDRSLKRKTDLFLRWKSIEDHLVTARWEKPARTRLCDTSSLHAELDIRNFIDAYLSEHGKLPVGDCIVGGTHVFFSGGDANV